MQMVDEAIASYRDMAEVLLSVHTQEVSSGG